MTAEKADTGIRITTLTIDEVLAIVNEAYQNGRLEGQLPQQVWNVRKCAEFLGVSTGTVYTLAANSKIPCRRAGDRYLFHPGAVAEWVANREK